MKKFIAISLCLILLLSMAACKPAKDTTPSTEGSSAETKPSTENTVPSTENTTPSTENNSSAGWDGMTAMEIMQKIAEKADTQIMAEVIDGSEFYLNALTLGELQFEEIALYMPMISSQRFEVAVIRVKEGTDPADYAADLESRAANAQWVCAAPPDYVKVVTVDDCVLYMAINSEFADEEAMVKAFQNPAA